MPVPEAYLDLLRTIEDTFRRKNAGYAGRAQDWDANFAAVERIGVHRETGVMVRLFDKWERLCNVCDDPNLDQVGESIDDTALDMANYLLILLTLRAERRARAEAVGVAQDATGEPLTLDEHLSRLTPHELHEALAKVRSRSRSQMRCSTAT